VVLYFLALAFVLACAVAYVFSNGVFDVGRFVTAVPIAAFSLAFLAILPRIGRRRRQIGTPGAPFERPSLSRSYRRRRRPLAGIIIFGVVGFTFGGLMVASAEHQQYVYNTDPSCRAGFTAVASGGGSCRLIAARIANAYYTGKYHSTRTLELRFADGTLHRVSISRTVTGTLWSSARHGTFLDATAQFEGTSIVQVQTAAGQIETNSFPPNEVTMWLFFAMVCGCIGAVSLLALYLEFGERAWLERLELVGG
jgi:hypothetical protein